jgi:formate dehydrogenase subunit gamma
MSAQDSSQPDNMDVVRDKIAKFEDSPGALLPVLHAVQGEFGFIPAETIPVIADGLNLSRAEVHGVVSFYHHFRSSPPGRNIVQICRAESCQSMGARKLEAHAKQSLNIDYHETSTDGEFTLLPVYCLGNCACSPSVRVGDDVYGLVDAEKFDAIVTNLISDKVPVT